MDAAAAKAIRVAAGQRMPSLTVLIDEVDINAAVQELPDAALCIVYLSLDAGSLCTMMEVCKQWYELGCWDVMWANVCKRVGVRGASRAAYRRRMEWMVCARHNDRHYQEEYDDSHDSLVYDDLVLATGDVRNFMTRYQYQSMAAKRNDGIDWNNFRTRGGFSAKTDMFVQIEFHCVRFGDEQCVGFCTEEQANEPGPFSATGYLNGRDGETIGNAPRYYNGDRISVRLDFDEDCCIWYRNGEVVHTMHGLPASRLYLTASPDTWGDVCFMKPFTSSTKDWLNGGHLEAVPVVPRRGRVSLFLQKEQQLLDLAPMPSVVLEDALAGSDWLRFYTHQMEATEIRSSHGGHIVLVIALLPNEYFMNYTRLALGLAKTTRLNGGYFAHTTDPNIFSDVVQSSGLVLPDSLSICAPCVFLIKKFDHKFAFLDSTILAPLSYSAFEVTPIISEPRCAGAYHISCTHSPCSHHWYTGTSVTICARQFRSGTQLRAE